MEKQGYKNLIAFQKAKELSLAVYQATNSFPREEQFGITSQLRRSIISVPANIAEGYRRNNDKEKIRFFNIAQGSLVESEFYLEFCNEVGYLNDNELTSLLKRKDDTGRVLHGLSRAIKKGLLSGGCSQGANHA